MHTFFNTQNIFVHFGNLSNNKHILLFKKSFCVAQHSVFFFCNPILFVICTITFGNV
jgi:hypothetical protein